MRPELGVRRRILRSFPFVLAYRVRGTKIRIAPSHTCIADLGSGDNAFGERAARLEIT